MARRRIGRSSHRMRRRRKRIGAAFLAALGIAAALFACILRFSVQPVIETYGLSHVRNLSVLAISAAVDEEMERGGEKYQNLVTFERKENGEITALTSNTVRINQLKSALATGILEKLSFSVTEIRIPLGSFISGDLLSGRGPVIPFRIVPLSGVLIDVKSVFSEAGINQTRHQVMLNVTVELGILMPVSSVPAEVHTEVCISDTILLGTVPDYYTSVVEEQGSDIADQLMNYGADKFADVG